MHFNHADVSGVGSFDVAENTSADLQDLINRLRGGDLEARGELLQRAYNRLLRIAAAVFHEDFPDLRDRHDLESVVSEVWMRLVGALEATQPQTVEGFFGLVFHKVRQVLLDMASRQRRDDRHRCAGPLDGDDSAALAFFDPADTTHDPARLAALTELHDEIEKLPDDQRTVFDLHYYGDFSQVEIAQMLDLNRKHVSRLWLAATGRLAKWLDGFGAELTCLVIRPEYPMQQYQADSQPPTKLAKVADSHGGDGAGSDADLANDRLLDLLEIWEDHHLRGRELTAESLAVDDPPLLQQLKLEIKHRKRLHAFLKLSPVSALVAPHAEFARERQDQEHNAPARDRPALRPPPPEALPATIGRYQVTRVLGQGGFGRVYLAHDPELDRDVAIKVPIPGGAAHFLDVEAYLREARILARLTHPNIVPVYDVGRTAECHFYVVSKYMDGGDLAARLRQGRPTFSESAALVAVLCDALHYTHTQDLFHRDIKPANILLDAAGTPSLADFGLALKDENFGQGAGHVGTAAYMSPEQARGEGHLVDGRSDVFSIGIVMYELLTGRRPFRGGSHQEVMEQIKTIEPRPPRQIDDVIPPELERICLKALSKRASERYTTAHDPAEDLRHFLRRASAASATNDVTQTPTAVAPAGAVPGVPPAPPSKPSDSSMRSVKIVPKGLCSFDEDDAEFFLELLPGPRDRDGLPDVLRFWKSRIEATDQDRTFRVGLIYGPSGCGKSSLVKAGLLTRLGRNVVSVYVEATAGQTEDRLVRGLAKRFPDLPAGSELIGSLAMLRRGHGLPAGHKALLVLDQFEQWLFGHDGAVGTELIAALRQCDGEHLQALCLVRDDFWMAATRFMKDLEIDLVPDRNIAAVDLFDQKHTRRVLAAYGRAYEALPAGSSELTKEQRTFLDEAVDGLAQDGRVVPVRLALFAEMIKGRPWTPVTLREVGGMNGVGVRFLEDTFSSARSQPNHRYHQRAAQTVLKALLPETNADIKGRMRSVEDLRALSGYADRPADFNDLVRMLDSELRLITPVDPEGPVSADLSVAAPGRLYFQLTHDYLVHALREWLTRKQRETLRGRAELQLAERTELWDFRPEKRFLPSWAEWVCILLLTRRAGWTERKRRMMRAATRYHGFRGAVIVGLLSVAAAAGVWLDGQLREQHRYTVAAGLVKQLLVAEIGQVFDTIAAMADHRDRVRPTLAAIAADPTKPPGERLRQPCAVAGRSVADRVPARPRWKLSPMNCWRSAGASSQRTKRSRAGSGIWPAAETRAKSAGLRGLRPRRARPRE